MTSFCTNCGSRFNDFSNFCTDCGSPGQDLANKMIISPPETLLHSNDSGDFNSAAMRFFANESAPMLPHYRNGEVCLVFTNLTLLRQYLGLEYDDLLTRISRLVNTSRSGLIYLLLDSSNTYLVARDRGTWASHVAILRAATDSLQRRLGARAC